MTTKEILARIQKHPSVSVKIAYADIDGILRGKYISKEKFLSIAEKQTSFCDVIIGWDASDVLYDRATLTGWHTGFPDTPSQIDVKTFRQIPWEDDQPFFLGELLDAQHQPSAACGRQLLKKIQQQANDMGFTPVFSQEFEWYNFAETPHSIREKNYKGLTPLTPGMFGYSILRTSLKKEFFHALFEQLPAFGIPLEGLHTETGPGTYEAAIAHANVMEAADRAVLFKTAVKEIAYQHQAMATFMAKVNETLPGCGGHIHQSLWDASQKKNLFYDVKDRQQLSETAKSYLAGQLQCLPVLLPMIAPTINSYKRLVEGAWAPTTLTWGIDNRTVALRVLNGTAAACRIETRVAGADVNPYLAMAACLAAGLYGIQNKLKLKQTATTGNGYRESSKGILPATLIEATRMMDQSPLSRKLLGKDFVDHFVQSREWEWRQHLKAVTDWEYQRYFEII